MITNLQLKKHSNVASITKLFNAKSIQQNVFCKIKTIDINVQYKWQSDVVMSMLIANIRDKENSQSVNESLDKLTSLWFI